jgi:SAM-dependent methyltransferase
MAPLLTHNDLRAVRKVLDVGCGPGTNARYFEPSAYLGIDINPEYVASARKRYPGRFEVADATAFAAGGETFDFVLVNSVLHHIDDPGTVRTLERLSGLLAPGGHVHILELVRPARPSVARALASWDRGAHARTRDRWEELFGARFDRVLSEPYRLGLAGVTLWNMLYFKGRSKR